MRGCNMEQSISQTVLNFIKKCDWEFYRHIYNVEYIAIAEKYIDSLNVVKKTNDSNIVSALISKLKFICRQIKSMNGIDYTKDNEFSLIPLSVTDYIICLVREKKILDPLLIARYVYIELCKVLYYDISYVRSNDPRFKKIICNAPVDLKNEKIFSYVVCTQWLKLYTYILQNFGIKVNKMNITGQDHVWGEIELNDNQIVIVDATDYINSSIDLSNAKATSRTVGFVVLPKKYSGIKLYDAFNIICDIDIIKTIRECYKLNRELDMTLGYITDNLYYDEKIIASNEIFRCSKYITMNSSSLKYFFDLSYDFFDKLKTPANMDGYEIYAFYERFRRKLPRIISSNISHDTFYVDSFFYKQTKMKNNVLSASIDYLLYLEELLRKRYYMYLADDSYNDLLEKIRDGSITEEELSQRILERQLRIAEVTKNINYYYAIDRMQFFTPGTGDLVDIKLFEPMMGRKTFLDEESYKDFMKSLIIK